MLNTNICEQLEYSGDRRYQPAEPCRDAKGRKLYSIFAG